MAKRTDITRLEFRFNTAITAVMDGKWDEKFHNLSIMPLRRRVMDIDGVTGCYVYRYGMTVEFEPTVIGMHRLANAVRQSVQDVAQLNDEGYADAAKLMTLFPLREDKMPRAIWKRPKATKPSSWIVVADFSSDLYSHKLPENAIKELQERTALSLMHADGARGAAVNPRQVYIRVINDPAAIASARDHLRTMVQNTINTTFGPDGSRFLDDDGMTFPFGDTRPEVNFWDRGSSVTI